MANYLAMFNFKTRLWLLAMPALLLLLFLSLKSFYSNHQQQRLDQTLQQDLITVSQVISIVTELQKERGLSAAFLNDPANRFHKRLEAQRRQTQEKLEQLIAFVSSSSISPPIRAIINDANHHLLKLNDIWPQIDQKQLPIDLIIQRYTDYIQQYLSTFPILIKTTHGSEIKSDLIALAALSRSQERLGMLRLIGTNAINQGKLEGDLYQRFSTLLGEYNAQQATFMDYTTNPILLDFQKGVINNEITVEAHRMEQVLLSQQSSAIAQESATRWWDITTQRIDTLSRLSQSYNAYLQNNLNAHIDQNTADAFVHLISFPLILLLVLISSSRVSKSLANEIQEQQALLLQQSKMATLGEMLSAIAHQWRQPLSSISVLFQEFFLKHQLNKLSPEDAEQISDKILHQIDYLSQTIDDFKNFIKPSQNDGSFNVVNVIEQALHIVGSQLDNNQIKVVIETYYDDLPCDDLSYFWVSGQESRFKQVIINLLNNARDAIIEQLAKNIPNRKTIWVDIYSNEQQCILKMRDSGGGIPVKLIPTIFDPYVTTKESQNGTGLGLYMSKLIVENHMHGRILANNTKEGAEFTVELKRQLPTPEVSSWI